MKRETKADDHGAHDAAQIDDSTLEAHMGYNLKRAFNVIQSDLTHALKPLGLRMLTYTALVLIVDNPGLRQSQLAEVMDVERPNLVVIIDDLEARGLITRDRVPTDRRAYALVATTKGQDLCRQANKAIHDLEERLLSGVSVEDRRRIIESMRIIRKSRR